ncbi:MAG TPA: NADP-dependent phosphogluconate dehydrogenase [Thermomicrobiales bacterium]|nr:NADP-dependent phosphogluconate dehydrogenase [Thermomicrobiales bacterium]
MSKPAAGSMAVQEKPRHDAELGLIGLGVMGENLALNVARNGFQVSVYNRTESRTHTFLDGAAADTTIHGAFDVPQFIASLAQPRRILLMVKAGAPVDAVIGEVEPYLDPGDIIIDGGNSFYADTERRSRELDAKGFRFVGMGVSGGEEGALWGPSLMPGGPRDAYAELEHMLVAISAKTEAGPCVTHVGPGGAGHYVKMVHNGIEYGDMQLIAESYDVMRRALGMKAPEMAEVFARWNEGKLASYLIEITASVLGFIDHETGQPLVDVIADVAEQKGTGRWTSQNALELGIPIPTIDAAVLARSMSSFKEQRVRASKVLWGPEHDGPGHSEATPPLLREDPDDKERLIDALEDALYFSKVSSYAQGMALLRGASETYEWNLDLSEIARIWKGGCIIRAKLLDPIREAFSGVQRENLDNLLLAPHITETVNASMAGCRAVIHVARTHGIPCPALSASLDYVDTYRQERLPANLIQAQRDFFGAHTYKRLDKEGTFHTVWIPIGPPEEVASTPSHRTLWEEGEGEGDRAPAGGDVPDAAIAHGALRPDSEEELVSDPEERGERSPETAKHQDF